MTDEKLKWVNTCYDWYLRKEIEAKYKKLVEQRMKETQEIGKA